MSLKACGGQRTTRSALALARGASLGIILPLGMFTSNSTKLNSVPVIAYNSNVHFARNVPFSQTRSHIVGEAKPSAAQQILNKK